MMVGLLDRVRSLWRGFGWLGVWALVHHFSLMMPFNTSPALMGVAVPV